MTQILPKLYDYPYLRGTTANSYNFQTYRATHWLHISVTWPRDQTLLEALRWQLKLECAFFICTFCGAGKGIVEMWVPSYFEVACLGLFNPNEYILGISIINVRRLAALIPCAPNTSCALCVISQPLTQLTRPRWKFTGSTGLRKQSWPSEQTATQFPPLNSALNQARSFARPMYPHQKQSEESEDKCKASRYYQLH